MENPTNGTTPAAMHYTIDHAILDVRVIAKSESTSRPTVYLVVHSRTRAIVDTAVERRYFAPK